MIIGYSIQPETTRGKKKHEKPEAKSNNCPKAKKPRSQEAEKTKGAKATKPQKPQKSQEPQKPRSQTENKKLDTRTFLPSFLPSLLPSFLPSFLPFILPSFFPVLFIYLFIFDPEWLFHALSPTRLYVKKYVKVQVKYFGWWFQPLWKILVNGKDYPIHYGK